MTHIYFVYKKKFILKTQLKNMKKYIYKLMHI
jgi:hypothetical protein